MKNENIVGSIEKTEERNIATELNLSKAMLYKVTGLANSTRF